jgi:hypothetical protein
MPCPRQAIPVRVRKVRGVASARRGGGGRRKGRQNPLRGRKLHPSTGAHPNACLGRTTRAFGTHQNIPLRGRKQKLPARTQQTAGCPRRSGVAEM